MITLSILKDAKAILCWDFFSGLAIQMVATQTAAWYFPPDPELDRIILFYDEDAQDQSNALFYLFHEAGHLLQKQTFAKNQDLREFLKLMELDKGAQKAAFEQQAWSLGEPYLEKFLKTTPLNVTDTLNAYRDFAVQCIASYQDKEA